MASPAKLSVAGRHAASHDQAARRTAAAPSHADWLPASAATPPPPQAQQSSSPPQARQSSSPPQARQSSSPPPARPRQAPRPSVKAAPGGCLGIEDAGRQMAPDSPRRHPQRAKTAQGRLVFCRVCGAECRDWELQMHLCPDCALERVLSGVPLSGRQMNAAGRRQAEADAQAARAGGHGTCGGAGGGAVDGPPPRDPAFGIPAPTGMEKLALSGTPPPKHRRTEGPRRRVGVGAGEAAFDVGGSSDRLPHSSPPPRPPDVAPINGNGADGAISWPESTARTPAVGRLQSFVKLRAAADARLAERTGDQDGDQAKLVWMTAEAAGTLDLLRCSVCLGYLDRTLAAPCMHRFCQDCVEKWLRMGRPDCPECKAPIHTRRSFRRAPMLRARAAGSQPVAAQRRCHPGGPHPFPPPHPPGAHLTPPLSGANPLPSTLALHPPTSLVLNTPLPAPQAGHPHRPHDPGAARLPRLQPRPKRFRPARPRGHRASGPGLLPLLQLCPVAAQAGWAIGVAPDRHARAARGGGGCSRCGRTGLGATPQGEAHGTPLVLVHSLVASGFIRPCLCSANAAASPTLTPHARSPVAANPRPHLLTPPLQIEWSAVHPNPPHPTRSPAHTTPAPPPIAVGVVCGRGRSPAPPQIQRRSAAAPAPL
eukprot:scaffold8224_cov118-Isochrysis_galbana.AAC.23